MLAVHFGSLRLYSQGILRILVREHISNLVHCPRMHTLLSAIYYITSTIARWTNVHHAERHAFVKLTSSLNQEKQSKAIHNQVKMIYELRIYTTIPGRMPNLLARFENHTLKIWERHGIKQLGFWLVMQS